MPRGLPLRVEQGTRTVKDGDAMVDGIQLGRVFTMFEKDEVMQYL